MEPYSQNAPTWHYLAPNHIADAEAIGLEACFFVLIRTPSLPLAI
jgi:hypothetical protein